MILSELHVRIFLYFQSNSIFSIKLWRLLNGVGTRFRFGLRLRLEPIFQFTCRRLPYPCLHDSPTSASMIFYSKARAGQGIRILKQDSLGHFRPLWGIFGAHGLFYSPYMRAWARIKSWIGRKSRCGLLGSFKTSSKSRVKANSISVRPKCVIWSSFEMCVIASCTLCFVIDLIIASDLKAAVSNAWGGSEI